MCLVQLIGSGESRTSSIFSKFLPKIDFLLYFFQPEDYDEIMNSLQKIFMMKAGANAPEDFFALQTASISSWTLLSTLLPSSRGLDSLEAHLDLFESLLEAGSLDLRIATGEALAVLYEAGYEADEEAVNDLVEVLIPRLQELSKDSHKYRSKKDRKEQKSSFRDILKTIEDGDEYYEKVAFSKRETLEITSWSMKKQYDHICKVIFYRIFPQRFFQKFF